MSKLPIHEMFYSIQGEGKNVGLASYFIRLAGCDVGCHWCDVKESWDKNENNYITIDEIISKISESDAINVVITGGEPCIYDLYEITSRLKQIGIYIMLETSGVYEIKGNFDWICLSPKKFKKPLEQNLIIANEIKVIVYNQHDFIWCTQFEKYTNSLLYLQAEWENKDEMYMSMVDFIKNNPNWKISIQIHKYLDIN